MSEAIDILNPQTPKRVAIVASDPSTSKQTGWPIGFWWSELVHPFWEFTARGYKVDIYSPDGGKLEADNWSDSRDESAFEPFFESVRPFSAETVERRRYERVSLEDRSDS